MVLTLIRDLPGDRLSCPRHRRIITTGLASASGGQDHTISSPRASRSSARPKPRYGSPRPSHSIPTSVTIAIRPLSGTERAEDTGDLGGAANDLCFSEEIDGFSEGEVIWATGGRGESWTRLIQYSDDHLSYVQTQSQSSGSDLHSYRRTCAPRGSLH
jgi:hypothetical protein